MNASHMQRVGWLLQEILDEFEQRISHKLDVLAARKAIFYAF